MGRAPGRLQTGLCHTAQRGRGRDPGCHSGAVSAWQGAWCTKTPTVTGRVKARRTRERLCSQPSVSSLSRDGGRPLTQGKTGISSRAGPGLRGRGHVLGRVPLGTLRRVRSSPWRLRAACHLHPPGPGPCSPELARWKVRAVFKRLKQSELLILMLSLSFSFNKRK